MATWSAASGLLARQVVTWAGWRALAVLALASPVACGAARSVERAPPATAPASVESFHDLLMSPEACGAPSAEWVSRAGALEDVNVVERILRRGYAGYELGVERGIRWADAMAQTREAIERAEDPISTDRLQGILIDALRPVSDNHLGIYRFPAGGKVDWRSSGHHADAYVSEVLFDVKGRVLEPADSGAAVGDQLQSCDGHGTRELLRASIREGDIVGRIVRLERAAPGPLTCQLRGAAGTAAAVRIALHRPRRAGEERRAPAFERTESTESGALRVTRLRVRDLAASIADKLQPFVRSATELRAAPAIVLDVRGNDGGSDGFVRDWFLELTAGPLHNTQIDKLSSEVTAQAWVNFLTCEAAEEGVAADTRAELEQEGDRARAELEERARSGVTYRRWQTIPREERGRAPAPFRGALVLLVDSGCKSSCEAFVHLGRQVGGALVLGENTGGVGEIGDAFRYRLPRSRLQLQLGMKRFRGSAEEGRGHLPDVWLDTETPDTSAVRIAACLADATCGEKLRADVAAFAVTP